MQFSAQIKNVVLRFLNASLTRGSQWPGVQAAHLVALRGCFSLDAAPGRRDTSILVEPS